MALTNALQYLIKDIQGLTYHEDLSQVFAQKTVQVSTIDQTAVCLFLDSDWLIHCSGRIHNAPLIKLAKFLVLLPANSLFSDFDYH